jgi:hypothetical protein
MTAKTTTLLGRIRAWGIAACAAILLPGAAQADPLTVTWTAPGDDGNVGRASSYDIRYRTVAISGTDTLSWWNAATSVIGEPTPLVAGSSESFTVNGLLAGTTYYFLIRTSDEVPNVSGFSNVSVRQTGSVTLATPSGFTAEVVSGDVRLTWETPASGAGSGYHIYRRIPGGSDTRVHTGPVGETSWSDLTVVAGTIYEYRIRTYEGTSEGVAAMASVTVPPVDVVLATPSSFTAEVVSGDVRLAWQTPATGVGSGYHIYRRIGSGGSDTRVHTGPVGETSWTDSTVVVGTTYEYRIRTYEGTSEGAPAMASVTVSTIQLAALGDEIRGYPNPARESVTLRYRGGTEEGEPGRVRIVIYDLNGRKICQLIDGIVSAGEHAIKWACRSDGGNPVAPGIYNVILDGPTGRSVTRLAIVP